MHKLQAKMADSKYTISTQEAQVRRQRVGTVVSKRAPANVYISAVCVGRGHWCLYMCVQCMTLKIGVFVCEACVVQLYSLSLSNPQKAEDED